jgi:hypothetical protein
MEDVGIFMAILSNIRPNGIFCGHLVYFSRFGKLWREKSGNPVAECSPVNYFLLGFSGAAEKCQLLSLADLLSSQPGKSEPLQKHFLAHYNTF